MNKYYYQRGMCEALHYNSLNPVLYESTDTENEYRKVKMNCNAIQKGVCNKEYNCQLLLAAPELVIDNGVDLRDKKL